MSQFMKRAKANFEQDSNDRLESFSIAYNKHICKIFWSLFFFGLAFTWHDVSSVKSDEFENFFVFDWCMKSPFESFHFFWRDTIPSFSTDIIVARNKHVVNLIMIFLDVENTIESSDIIFEFLFASYASFVYQIT